MSSWASRSPRICCFAILDGGKIDWDKVTRQPLILHENANVLRVMEQLRGSIGSDGRRPR